MSPHRYFLEAEKLSREDDNKPAEDSLPGEFRECLRAPVFINLTFLPALLSCVRHLTVRQAVPPPVRQVRKKLGVSRGG